MKDMTLKEIEDRKELLRLQKVYVDVKMIVEELRANKVRLGAIVKGVVKKG